MRNAYLEEPRFTRTLNITPGEGIAIAAGVQGVTSILGKNAASSASSRGYQAIADATAQSNALIAQANADAARLIKEGNEAAAAAVVKAAKIAAQALLEATGASIEAQKEFAAKANKVLQPTIRQGRFAMDEIASMLAIPNSKGKLVPFDISKLTDLPSFQTGMRAIEHAAVGKKLSTQQAERAALFGADFFGQRVNQLQFPAGLGAMAERQQAAGLYGAGANIGNTIMSGGQGQADIALKSGTTLAELANLGAAQQAQLGINTANALSNNALGVAGAQAQNLANQGAIQGNYWNQIGNLGMLPFYASMFSGGGGSGINPLSPAALAEAAAIDAALGY
jgi:hypothetical protein